MIRRSGENISSAEIEAALLDLKYIKNAAVCAYPHDIYEEEVLAFIVLKRSTNSTKAFSKKILKLLSHKLAYYKLPGYIQFTENIPVTSTQKVLKSELLKKLKNEKKSEFYELTKFKKNFK